MATVVLKEKESLECTDVLETIIRALATIKKLNLNSLVNGTLLGLKNTIDELTRNVTTYSDPQIEFEIQDLRQKLVELRILITRRFIPGCKSVARFATRSGQLERIRADMEAGRVGKLREFLDILGNHINTCQKRANTFQSEFDALKQKVGIAITEHGKEQRKLKEDIRSKEKWSHCAKVAGGTMVTVGVLGSGVGLVATASIGVAYMVLSGGIVGGLVATGAAGGLSIAHKFTKDDYDRIQSVTKHVNDLNEELGDLNEKFMTVSGDLQSAKESLENEIKDGKSIQAEDVESVMPALKDFIKDMATLLTSCEEAAAD